MEVPEEINSLDDVEADVQEAAGAVESRFQDFTRRHSKQYERHSEEYKKRMSIFAESEKFVAKWNNDPKSKFKVAINQFADLTAEEFASGFQLASGLEEETQSDTLDARVDSLMEESDGFSADVGEEVGLRHGPLHQNSGKKLPKSVDWSKGGRTGRVYKQGVCAACYTFATNGAVEGAYYIKTGKKMPELSDQEILSCSRPYGNHGCIGGNMEKSYHYIMAAQDTDGGLTLAKDYPYEGAETKCKRSKFKAQQIRLAGYRKVERGNEQDLKDALSERPVAVGIDAHHPAFKLYSSGVFDIDYCTTHLTHAVLLTGYGTTKDGKDYWTLQNSWGDAWGEKGYGKVARGKNMCAIANLASYPVLKEPENWEFSSEAD